MTSQSEQGDDPRAAGRIGTGDGAEAADTASEAAGAEFARRFAGTGRRLAAKARVAAAALSRAEDQANEYLLIAAAQAAAGDAAGAAASRDAACDVVRAIEDGRERNRACQGIGTALARAGDVGRAKALADTLDHPLRQSWVYRAIAAAQARAGDAVSAAARAEAAAEAAGDEWVDDSVTTWVPARTPPDEAADLAEAKADAEVVDDRREKVAAYGKLAVAQVLAGDADGALATAEALDAIAEARSEWKGGRQPSVPEIQEANLDRLMATGPRNGAFCELARAQARVGDRVGARVTAAAIRPADDKAEVCRVIAAAMVAAGEVSDAEAWAESVTEPLRRARILLGAVEGLPLLRSRMGLGTSAGLPGVDEPDEGAPVPATSPANSPATAGAAPARLARVRRLTEGVMANVKRESKQYADLADLQARAGDVAGAKATAGAIADAGKRAEAYGRIVQAQVVAQCKAGDVAGARATADAITDAARKAEAYATLAQAQARAGDVGKALATAGVIADAGGKASVYLTIVDVRAWAGDVNGAGAAAEALSRALADDTDPCRLNQKVLAYSELAVAQAGAGDAAGAASSWETARAAADAIPERNPEDGSVSHAHNYKRSAYNEIAERQARAGDVARVSATADALAPGKDRLQLKARALKSGAARRAEAGDLRGASVLWDEAKAAADALYEGAGLAWVNEHCSIAEYQARRGDVTGGTAWCARVEAEVDAMNLPYHGREEAYCRIATAWAQLGDPARAALLCAKAKAAADAIGIEFAKSKQSLYDTIAQAQARAGDVAGAKATAEAIIDADKRVYVWCLIAQAQAKAGDVAGVLATAEAIHPGSMRRGDVGTSVVKKLVYRDIAEAQMKAGDLAGAKATAAAIEYADERKAPYRAIAEAQTRAGDVAGVEAWAAAEQERELRAEILIGALEGLVFRDER